MLQQLASEMRIDGWPKIISDQEHITVSPDDNLTLTCEGTNVTWKIFGVINEKNDFGKEHFSILPFFSINRKSMKYFL